MTEQELVRIFAKARFKFRSDTAANWEDSNPTLFSGEFGVVTNPTDESERVKIGDGVTPWNELGWWKGPKGDTGAVGPQGEKGEKGADGQDYILTEADKNEIAGIVLSNFTDVSEVGQ